MIYCKNIKTHLESFYNQALDRDQEKELLDHMSSCEKCRLEFNDDFKMMKILTSASVNVSPERNLAKAVISALAPSRRNLYYLAAAAVLFIVTSALFIMDDEPVMNPGKSIVKVQDSQKNTSIHTVYEVSGGEDYEIIRDGIVYSVDEVSEIVLGSEIYSFSKIRLKCNFMNISLNHNAHITIGQDDLRFHYGTVKFDFKKLERPFHVNTSYSTITITGTSFTLYKHSVDSVSTTFELRHGSVELEHHTGKTVIIKTPGKFQITETEIVNLDGSVSEEKKELTTESRAFSME